MSSEFMTACREENMDRVTELYDAGLSLSDIYNGLKWAVENFSAKVMSVLTSAPHKWRLIVDLDMPLVLKIVTTAHHLLKTNPTSLPDTKILEVLKAVVANVDVALEEAAVTSSNSTDNLRYRRGDYLKINETHNGFPSVFYTIDCGCDEVTKFLVDELGADRSVGEEGINALHALCQYPPNVFRMELFKYLIATNLFDINAPSAIERLTPFMYLATNSNLEGMRLLLDKGGNAHYENDKSYNALHAACSYGSVETVRFLIEELKCDEFKVTDDSFFPLLTACYHGRVDLMKYFLYERGHNPDNTPTQFKWSCAHVAAQEGKVEALEMLIKEGVDLDVQSTDTTVWRFGITEDGSTPLHSAVRYNQLAAAQLLIDNGCNLWIRDARGETAIEVSQLNQEEYAPMLIYLRSEYIQEVT